MHVFTFFLKVGFHRIFPRDCTVAPPGNPGRVSGSGLVS